MSRRVRTKFRAHWIPVLYGVRGGGPCRAFSTGTVLAPGTSVKRQRVGPCCLADRAVPAPLLKNGSLLVLVKQWAHGTVVPVGLVAFVTRPADRCAGSPCPGMVEIGSGKTLCLIAEPCSCWREKSRRSCLACAACELGTKIRCCPRLVASRKFFKKTSFYI